MMNKHSLRRFLGSTLAGLTFAAAAAAEVSDPYSISAFTLPKAKDKIINADFNGDGKKDLLTAADAQLSVYLQSEKGFALSKPSAQLTLPGQASGWDIVESPKGAASILVLMDGKQVQEWQLKELTFSSNTLLDGLDGFLPSGHYPLDFYRDINGDGNNDLLIPGRAELSIILAQSSLAENPGFGEPLKVRSRMWNETRLQAENGNLANKIGQHFIIPGLRVRDLNGDGNNDLIARSRDLLDVFLSDSNGQYPEQASYTVDYASIREELGEPGFEDLDMGNLSSALSYTYEAKLKDINGDGIEDLTLREGGKVSLFLGTATGMAMERPQQVLKSSGNVLTAILRDENEDGRPDLWLARLEDISLGNLFVWLALSGSVDIDFFVYLNEGNNFAKRPTRKLTITIKFPSFLNIISGNEETEAKVNAQGTPRITAANVRGTTDTRDIVLLKEKSVALFLNRLRNEEGDGLFGLRDYNRKKNRYVFDMGKILAKPSLGGNRYFQAIEGQAPELDIPVSASLTPQSSDVFALSLNGDEIDDLLIFNQLDGDSVSGFLLLSR